MHTLIIIDSQIIGLKKKKFSTSRNLRHWNGNANPHHNYATTCKFVRKSAVLARNSKVIVNVDAVVHSGVIIYFHGLWPARKTASMASRVGVKWIFSDAGFRFHPSRRWAFDVVLDTHEDPLLKSEINYYERNVYKI